MSSLHLPRVISQRGKPPHEVERENFEKAQTVSINKAINSQENPVKEKHVRSAILGTFHENGAGVFWSVTSKLPLQGNPIICWKFCHVLHKLIREGHPNVIVDSQKYCTLLKDIGNLWGHLKEGYGRLIAAYCKLLNQKLAFHHKNSRIPGNLSLTDDQFTKMCGSDVNSYFEISVDLLDYLDEILIIQQAVFGSLDMSRSNSMTNSGQCRLAPLIPCILDSCQLYDYLVKSLFKLHSSLTPDTLSGHRDRFLSGYKRLKQFYYHSGNLQYFKNLVQVPQLPDDPPNFLIASDFSKHVKPVAVVPSEPDPEVETPEVESIGFLIDTASTQNDSDKFVETFGLDNIDTFNFNGAPEPDERNTLIERLSKEIHELREELEQVKLESQQKIGMLQEENDQLKKMMSELQVSAGNTLTENENLKRELDEAKADKEVTSKLLEVEKSARSNEDKFKKMKEIYGKLREEHVTLLRTHAEVNKQLATEKKSIEEKEQMLKDAKFELDKMQQKQAVMEDSMQKSASEVNEQLDAATSKNMEFERNQEASGITDLSDEYRKTQVLENELKSLLVQNTQQEAELQQVQANMASLEQKLDKTCEEKHSCEEQLGEQLSALKTQLSQNQQERAVAEQQLKSELSNLKGHLCQNETEWQGKEKHLNETVLSLQQQLKESECQRQLAQQQHNFTLEQLEKRVVSECQTIIQDAESQVNNPSHLTVTCTAEFLLCRTEPIEATLEKLKNTHQNCNSDESGIHDFLASVSSVSHHLADCIIHGIATSHSAQIEPGEELVSLCRKVSKDSLSMLELIKNGEDGKVAEQIDLVISDVKSMNKLAEALLPKIEDVKAKEIGNLVDIEMQSTAEAIEQAAARIEEMLKKTREDNSGVELEVNERILDACTSLMKAIKVLVEKSKDLQKEIIAQGRGTSSAKEFYKKHHRWTEGLISAAKAVGWGATALVESADRVVQGQGKFEELIACSQEIAASTAQLVVSSKVKADRSSQYLSQLSAASKSVNQATGNVVASAKTGSRTIEDQDLMDFTNLNLHQSKLMEMQTQVRVLELETSLEKERMKLGEIRKKHYQLAGESEGWDVIELEGEEELGNLDTEQVSDSNQATDDETKAMLSSNVSGCQNKELAVVEVVQ